MLGAGWHLELPRWGGPEMSSVVAMAAAARFRAAVVTLSGWQRWAALLREAAVEHATLAELGRDEWWPTWWDSPPLVYHLGEATTALRDDRRVRNGALAGLEEAFVSPRPQAIMYRTLRGALEGERILAALRRRVRSLGG